MKKILLIMGMLILTLSMNAQTSYQLTYEMTINLHANLPKGKKYLKAILPETATQKLRYQATEDRGLLCMLKGKSDGNVQMQGDDKAYLLDFKKRKCSEYIEMEGYRYFVTKELEEEQGNCLDEVKQILGYNCNKLILPTQKGEEMTLWYTKDLSFNATPMPPMIAPGAILEIESTKISYKAVAIDKINKPVDLSKYEEGAMEISSQQFEDLQQEKLNASGAEQIRMTL